MIGHSPRCVSDGMVFCIDALNPKSYSGSGTIWTDLINDYDVNLAANATGPTFTSSSFQFRNTTNMFVTTSFDEGVLRNNNMNGAWTIEILFKHISAPSTSECILAGRSGCHGGIYMYANNVLYHAIKTTESNCWTGAVNAPVATLVPGQIYHSVFTYENGQCYHYLNGDLGPTTGSSIFNKTTYTMTGYSTPFYIGGITDRMTNSDIALVRCYDRSLTADEVAQNHKSVSWRIL